jgi:transposase
MGQEKMNNAVAHTPDQITIGIDSSKDLLDVHLHPERIVKQFGNDRKAIAKLIAWITPRQPAPELLAARRALVKDRTAGLNRSKTLTLALLKHQTRQHLSQIETQISAIDREQATIVAANESLKARSNILVSIPGFGGATACALLTDMLELGSMNAKQTGSLTGLAPVTRQSGNWRKKSVIQGGRANLEAGNLHARPGRHPLQPTAQGKIFGTPRGR